MHLSQHMNLAMPSVSQRVETAWDMILNYYLELYYRETMMHTVDTLTCLVYMMEVYNPLGVDNQFG